MKIYHLNKRYLFIIQIKVPIYLDLARTIEVVGGDINASSWSTTGEPRVSRSLPTGSQNTIHLHFLREVKGQDSTTTTTYICIKMFWPFLTEQLICAEVIFHFYLCCFLYQVNIFDINAEKSTFISISCSSSAAKVWGLAEWPVCWRGRVGGALSPTLPSITTPCTILTNGVALTRPWGKQFE